MQTTSREVHFSVEPQFYERHARSLMLEENWRGAIRFLQTTLTDLPLDVAVQVLQGKLSLKGDGEGGVTVGPQDPKDTEFIRFQETYAWQHAGILQVDAEFYQPYGAVKDFCEDDQAYAEAEMAVFYDRDYTPNEYRTLRARFHAHNRESDLIRFDKKLGAVYFKRIPGPAFWHPAFDDWEVALADFRKARRLENIFRGEEPRATAKKQDLSRDPSHWKFYLGALRMGRLREPRWDEQLLEVEVLNTLLGLLERQNQVQEAVYAAEAHSADEDLDERDGEGDEDESVAELRDRFETAVLRAEIRERARTNGGFIELTLRDYTDRHEPVVSVPAIPLMRWAARNIKGFRWEDLPEWRPVCPSGMKMLGDNPMHTDWWVGAGFEPQHGYAQEHPLNKAAWRFALYLSESHGCAFVKLAGKGRVLGRVTFPRANEAVLPGSIAVVPYAGVDYEVAMLSACKGGHGAVISAVGGKLAHLATVARETEARLVVVDNAMEVFKEGELVTLDLEAMTLTRHETLTAPRTDSSGD